MTSPDPTRPAAILHRYIRREITHNQCFWALYRSPWVMKASDAVRLMRKTKRGTEHFNG